MKENLFKLLALLAERHYSLLAESYKTPRVCAPQGNLRLHPLG
jgi:hypothetical protein